ncbi:hypothetical protein MTR67_019776 [Solanum verrucosum]|uniref:Gag-pol polyprotein n=1 Tax=Solanum verrucosum TaxID=315347 RepID=A0AAF0TNJ9_SOLVR|nr:hypothetical protein MTR67_019776 [Solanum verrucosum]
MNPPKILRSQVGEDPQNFIGKVKKIFGVMRMTGNGRVELASYQLKDVAHVCVSPETLSEHFSVSTPVGDPVIARRVYRDCPISASQKVTSTDLVKLEMVDFDIILGMDWFQFCHASVDGQKEVNLEGGVAHIEEKGNEVEKDVHRLALLGVSLTSTLDGGVIVQNRSESSLVVEVKEKQDNDPILLELKGAVQKQTVGVFSQGGDGVLRYQGRLCVPDVSELRQHILTEPHNSRYSIHPGATKMYRDLREIY